MNKKSKRTYSSYQEQIQSPDGDFVEKYGYWHSLFEAQSATVQNFFEIQARSLADALLQPASQIHIDLPLSVLASTSDVHAMPLPFDQREYTVGGFIGRLTSTSICASLCQRLDELESSKCRAVAASAGLLRFAVATALVRDILPPDHQARYQAGSGEEIPTLPIRDNQTLVPVPAIPADASSRKRGNLQGEDRIGLLSTHGTTTQQLLQPQWLAYDEQYQLVTYSIAEAKAQMVSLKHLLHIFQTAEILAPYMIVDETYLQKRDGALDHLIHQGQALAYMETRRIIATIQRRAEANNLNRGLSISLPYFDDQILEMKQRNFEIIPYGLIMFISAFVVLAVRQEMAKVEQDKHLSHSTRNHLIAELHILEEAFQPDGHN